MGMSSGNERPPRVPSAWGPKGPQPEGEGPQAVLPPILLPPVRLKLEPELDAKDLAAVFAAVRDGVYAAMREGMAAAVRDFAAEQLAGYDDGGPLQAGLATVYNGAGEAEPVVAPDE
jgi:hypothetical protein